MLSVTFDEKLGILRTISAGFTSDSDVETYIRRSTELRKIARGRRGNILHLVEATETPVQSQAAMASLTAGVAQSHHPDDRTAVIVKSALAILQARRTSPQGTMEKFASEDEALAWLLGDEYRDLAC